MSFFSVFVRLVSLIALLIMGVSTYADDTVGFLKGSFSVNDNGAGTYSLPISLPPGINNFQPGISIDYNSQAGYTELGKGWFLSGVSSIGRCPRNYAEDGYIDAVDYDDNDVFCMGGARLLYDSGSADYVLNDGSNVSIEAVGIFGSGPEYFKVQASGVTSYYGKHVTSSGSLEDVNARYFDKDGAEIFEWKIAAQYDQFGNSIVYQYEGDSETGIHRINTIEYGDYSVVFDWFDRNSELVSPHGTLVSNTGHFLSYLLDEVRVLKGASLLYSYEFNFSENNNVPILTDITKCNGDSVCYSPVIFNWNEVSSLDFMGYQDSPGSGSQYTRFYLGDFDGNGCTDYVYHNYKSSNARFRVSLSNCDGTFQGYRNSPGSSDGDTKFYTGDFDGNGCTDYVYHNYSSSNARFRVSLSNCDGTFQSYKDSPGSSDGDTKFYTGDFDGNGCTDYVYHNYSSSNSSFRVSLSNCDGTFQGYQDSPGSSSQYARFYLGDFDGNGCTDYVHHKYNSSNSSLRVNLSNCDGTFQGYQDSPGSSSQYARFYLGDFDGNGCTDYVHHNYKSSNARFRVRLSNCDGTFQFYKDFPGSSNEDTKFYTGDFDGDGATDYVYHNYGDSSNASFRVSLALRNESELTIKSFENDGIEFVKASYISLTNPDAPYVSGMPSFNGNEDVRSSPKLHVVEEVFQYAGNNEFNSTLLSYSDLRHHRLGFGPLGFASRTNTVSESELKTITNYSQDWEKHAVGMVVSTQTIAPNSTVLSESVNELENRFEGVYQDRFLPYVKSTTSVQRDLDGSIINTTTLENLLNDQGWVEQDQTCVTGDDLMAGVAGDMSLNDIVPCAIMPGKETHKITTYDYYSIATAPEFAPLLERKTTSITIPDAPPFQPATETRVVEYDYYLNTGQVKHETLEPDSTEHWLRKSYAYHSSGQMEATTTTGSDIQPRTSSVVYDPLTLMPVEKINTKGHKQQFEYDDSRFPWLVTKVTGPNGGWSKTYYNSWGAKERAESGHGTTVFGWSTSEKRWCDGYPCLSGELFYEVADSATAEPAYIYFDVLGREVRRELSTLRNGEVEKVFKNTEYNELGQVVWAGHPYFAGSVEYGSVTTYDILGRPESIQDAANEISSIEYHGRTVVYTDPKLHKKTVVKNALGQKVQVRDNRENAIAYRYDAFGSMVYMLDPDGNETRIGYNIRGFKTQLDDPDQGQWTYSYNVLGQLTDQTDAKQQVTHTEYDVLGRMISRTDHYGTPQAAMSNWYYDDTSISATAIGKLTQVTNNQNYAQTIRYDAYGRPYETTTMLDGEAYTNSTSYDEFSRVLKSVYPTGFAVENRYHSVLGSLESIVKADTDTNPDNNYLFWKAESFSARGQLQQSSLGGIINSTRWHDEATGMVDSITATHTLTGSSYQELSYSWDSVGNLDEFDDARQGVSETYAYDDLNRLLDVNGSNGVTSTRYDELGNITSKSGVGSYSYGISIPGECGTGYSVPGPHAVQRITGAKANYFCYDANGNLVKDKDRNLKYTGFNKPYEINRGTTQVRFDYGPGRSRFKREDRKNGSVDSITYYLGGYEKVIEGGTVKHKITIGGVAQVIEKDSGTVNVNYFLKDHLGSITAIVNEWGTVQEEMSYDAWGTRRLTNLMLLSDPFTYKNDFTNRGFTGHEHVDSVGLIHMNGRVYDPVISRFLSADPIVQAPSNLQSLNRYSYVLNNPLSMTDPSGFSWVGKKWKSFKKRAKRFVVAAIGWHIGATTGAQFGYQYKKGRELGLSASDAAKFGAKITTIQSASTLAGAATGAWLGQLDYIAMFGSKAGAIIGEGVVRVLAHSAIGGLTAKVSGGNFADGAAVSGTRTLYSYGMGVYVGNPDAAGFFTLTENPVLAVVEQTIVAAAVAKSRGMDSSGAAFSQAVSTSLMAFLVNESASHNSAQKGNAPNDGTKLTIDWGETSQETKNLMALQEVFGPLVDVFSVNIVENDLSTMLSGNFATTRPNTIYLSGSKAEFFSYSVTVIEEHFHVLWQWNPGTVTRSSWLAENLKNGYDQNRFELEAKGFARANARHYDSLRHSY